jgi:hypothetical protein
MISDSVRVACTSRHWVDFIDHSIVTPFSGVYQAIVGKLGYGRHSNTHVTFNMGAFGFSVGMRGSVIHPEDVVAGHPRLSLMITATFTLTSGYYAKFRDSGAFLFHNQITYFSPDQRDVAGGYPGLVGLVFTKADRRDLMHGATRLVDTNPVTRGTEFRLLSVHGGAAFMDAGDSEAGGSTAW